MFSLPIHHFLQIIFKFLDTQDEQSYPLSELNLPYQDQGVIIPQNFSNEMQSPIGKNEIVPHS